MICLVNVYIFVGGGISMDMSIKIKTESVSSFSLGKTSPCKTSLRWYNILVSFYDSQCKVPVWKKTVDSKIIIMIACNLRKLP